MWQLEIHMPSLKIIFPISFILSSIRPNLNSIAINFVIFPFLFFLFSWTRWMKIYLPSSCYFLILVISSSNSSSTKSILFITVGILLGEKLSCKREKLPWINRFPYAKDLDKIPLIQQIAQMQQILLIIPTILTVPTLLIIKQTPYSLKIKVQYWQRNDQRLWWWWPCPFPKSETQTFIY